MDPAREEPVSSVHGMLLRLPIPLTGILAALKDPSGRVGIGSGGVYGDSANCETYGTGKRRCCAAWEGREEFRCPMFNADSDSELTLGRRLNCGVPYCIDGKVMPV